jgi:hypothetical protein
VRSKPEAFWKQALAVFGVTTILYIGGFWLIENWRGRRGPWEVTFRADPNGTPVLEITEPRLGIARVELAFTGANVSGLSTATTVRFDQPAQRDAVPFGRVKFLDTTQLPGTVTLDAFGHEIELLPRTLILDKREHPWRSGERIELPAK